VGICKCRIQLHASQGKDMKQILKKGFLFLSYMLPFIVAGSVYIILQKPKTIENSIEEFEQANTSNQIYMANWLENKRKILENDFFSSLRIRKENKILKFEDLDKRKQEVLKFMMYSKVKKDCDAALANKENLEGEQYRMISNFRESVVEKTNYQKKIIYNYYGSDLHPLDKIFLDEYDVYLLN